MSKLVGRTLVVGKLGHQVRYLLANLGLQIPLNELLLSVQVLVD